MAAKAYQGYLIRFNYKEQSTAATLLLLLLSRFWRKNSKIFSLTCLPNFKKFWKIRTHFKVILRSYCKIHREFPRNYLK